MIKKKILFIVICLMCVSCGVKNDPEFKTQNSYNKNIYLV